MIMFSFFDLIILTIYIHLVPSYSHFHHIICKYNIYNVNIIQECLKNNNYY